MAEKFTENGKTAASSSSRHSRIISYPWTDTTGTTDTTDTTETETACGGPNGPNGLVAWSKRGRALLESLAKNDTPCDITPEPPSDPSDPSDEAVLKKLDLHHLHHASNDTNDSNVYEEDVFKNAVQDDPHARSLERILKRCRSHRSTQFQSDSQSLIEIPEELARVSAEDVIITVMLCDQKGFKEQEYDVLASQALHDLKDALYFVGDWTYDGPRTRSACMFIDGAFYSDMRQPSAVDYGKELVEWIEKAGHPKLKAEPLRTMATRFCDLERIPYGEKCCYIRQGDIEHLMYFTGARLLNKTLDCPLREAYPCLIWMRRYQKKRCVVCKKLLASWVVLDSSRCPFNPAHFCRICFKHFSQDERGEYIPPLDYKVFPYLHEESEAS